MDLVKQELDKNPSEEELKKIAVKAEVSYNSVGEYFIQVHFHPQVPFKAQLEQLITNTPLKLEIEQLKEKQEQLPTPENFEKLTKQVRILENYLRGNLSEGEYQKIKEEVDKII